ncbi:MAG: Xaa-Pro peptidase family protein [Spirochaetaceae bacterium]|nr:Xaa-Pro peptidase family protein [Spirochaetaceae bacterium]
MAEKRIKIPRSEFADRIKKVQGRMAEEGIDVLIAHACECESANVRYLTDFWAVFDFVGVVIPREGKPVLLTGGPESYDFAVKFAQIDDIRINPLYVETSAPQWDKPTTNCDYAELLEEFRQRFPIRKIGITNSNIFPHTIMSEIQKGAAGAEIVFADDLLIKLRWMKSRNEIAVLREACRITEEAIKQTMDMIRPGVREWEIEAAWRGHAYAMGAEGTSYPIWVSSGPSTFQSLCKSGERKIENNEMVQLSLGAKYGGYCGNICRPIVFGLIPQQHRDMIRIAHDSLLETIQLMRPGVSFTIVYEAFQKRLTREGFAGLSLYGPAHGTGLQECEGPWIDNRTDYVLMPGMAFNVDIWVANDKYGVRFEDGVLVTEKGLEELTSWHREPIEL